MKRHLQGLGLLVVAAFIAQAPRCGLLGLGLSKGLNFLLGAYGTSLSVLALVIAAIIVSGLGQDGWHAAKWLLAHKRERTARSETARVAKPAQGGKVVQLRIESSKIKDVRGGLKMLGYTPAEIDTVLERVDGSKMVEEMLREALKLLRKVA